MNHHPTTPPAHTKTRERPGLRWNPGPPECGGHVGHRRYVPGMDIGFDLTLDCDNAAVLTAFYRTALSYVA